MSLLNYSYTMDNDDYDDDQDDDDDDDGGDGDGDDGDGGDGDDGDGDVARYATLLFARLVSCPRQACPVCISLTRPVGNAVYRPPELVRRYLFQQLFQAEVFQAHLSCYLV